MLKTHDPDHLETAERRFRSFFAELRETFIERDDLLVQFALALLGRQHVLMTGSPGTAKSQMAALVLGRIIDETTGDPSLFARQFTESTVQTDLVGPIDFKTLMDSGRTEHFTDEGMLGSVHAFLDEVFDGRDMLLRSTLNLLHERELKQGDAISKGRIECAFMTSNRYIAEVLDGARETLLAFIDRIAFLSFVPRGFSSVESLQTVVRRHGGGFGHHVPTAYLSVQDLDVLQAATDLTYVPETVCDAVAELVTSLDAELAEAQRYDPKFQPTRFFSARTAVLATQALRSIVMYDKIFVRPERPLRAEHDDLAKLRYYLLLNGVAWESIPERIERESDPRERRQLDIMATEVEIFERCFAKLSRAEAPPPTPRIELGRLREIALQARNSGEPDALEKAVRQLIEATESGAADARDAAPLLDDTVGELSDMALRGGLTPDLRTPRALSELSERVTRLAEALEQASGASRPLAHWLRGRLLHLVDESLHLGVTPAAETITLLTDPSPSVRALAEQIGHRFRAIEAMAGLRRRLTAGRASVAGSATSSDAWEHALAKFEDELSLLWDARFRLEAVGALAEADRLPLEQVLRKLEPVLDRLRADARRVEALGARSSLLFRVTGPRIEPLVARVFHRTDGADRMAAIAEVEGAIGQLRRAGLGEVITPERFVIWTAPALVQGSPEPESIPEQIRDRASYDRACAQEAEVSLVDTLTRIAIAARPLSRGATPEGAAAHDMVWKTLDVLDDATREAVINVDVARARRAVERLEHWWGNLAQGVAGSADESGQAPSGVGVLEAVAQSGYLRATRGESEPLRIATELEHLSEVFAAAHQACERLRRRLVDLDDESTKLLVGLLEDQGDRAWADALGTREPS